nr:Kex2 endoprotease [Saccharomyces cerevisiae, Peptide Partial, 12 aa] [Saccharomyces cerevisiae]
LPVPAPPMDSSL